MRVRIIRMLKAKELRDDDTGHYEDEGGAEVAEEGALEGWEMSIQKFEKLCPIDVPK